MALDLLLEALRLTDYRASRVAFSMAGIFFLFSFGQIQGIWRFLGQGLNPCLSSHPSHCRDNARSLAPVPQGELPESSIKYSHLIVSLPSPNPSIIFPLPLELKPLLLLASKTFHALVSADAFWDLSHALSSHSL